VELIALLQKPELKPRTMEEIRAGIKPMASAWVVYQFEATCPS
jgi:hypothetical protein